MTRLTPGSVTVRAANGCAAPSSGRVTTMAPSSLRDTVIGSATVSPGCPWDPDRDVLGVDGDVDTGGNRHRLLTNTRHVQPHHTCTRGFATPTAAWRVGEQTDDVEMIATPRPPSTRWSTCVDPQTGLDTRRRPARLAPGRGQTSVDHQRLALPEHPFAWKSVWMWPSACSP